MKKVFTGIIVLIITSFYATGQTFTYHEDDKEGMRVFLRQPSNETGKINAEQLGLQISDTLNWYSSDFWISKVAGFTWKLYDYYRIAKIECGGKNLAGQFNGEKWSRLETLHCYDNELTVVNVGKNTYLNHLACDNNPLQLLNINGAVSLLSLYCHNTNLTALELNTNVKLVSLDCSNNELTDMDISQCPALTILYCYNNKITLLDVNANPNLTNVRCENNQIADFRASEIHTLVALNISNNPPLTSLNCRNNRLAVLDISGNTKIITLYCNDNNIVDIDVSTAVDLVEFDCSGNLLLGTLDISKNTKLTALYCSNNQLSFVDVSNAVDLIHFDCSHNWLTSVNVTKNTKLITFHCNANQIPAVEVGNLANLIKFDCSDNLLTSLDVTKNTKLDTLNFSINNITDIDLSKNEELVKLECSDNLLKTLNTIQNCPLEYLNCSNNWMLPSELLLQTDTIMTTFIYSPQKMYDGGSVDYKDKIDLTKEYNIDGNITIFSWHIYTKTKTSEKREPVKLEGEYGLFTPVQKDITGSTLRCKIYNPLFPDIIMTIQGRKDTVLVYEVAMTGVGIEEISATSHIYPNPTDGKVVIQNVKANIEKIQIFDISGKMVFETRETTFDIAHLPTAIYLIRIRTDEGILTKKITKR